MTKSNDKKVMFLGTMTRYSDVHDYYVMMCEGYNKYCMGDKKMTPARRLYIMSFKKRVDALAKLLDIDKEVSLPANINKVVAEPKNENAEDTK